jgi:cell division protein ZipA
MEQLSIRDWMVIVGGIMIAAVLVDAGRRFWRERHAEIRLNARIERSRSHSDEDDAFNLLTELPNGGARIVRCDDLSVGEVDAADLDMEDAEAEFSDAGLSSEADELGEHGTPIKGERDFASAPDPIDVAVERDEMGDTVTPADPVAKVVDEPVTEETVSDQSLLPEVSASTSRRRTVKPASDPSTSSQPDSNAQGTVDWLDNLEPDEASERDSVEQGRLPRGANTHVFILYVVARSEEGFAGMDILQTLLSCDLRFGDMDFFHRHELASGRGPIEFSVANMMKPGVFDIDNMEPLQTRGLMFFVTLPGPTDMLKAFDYMYETAKVAAKALDGDIQDEKRSVVTRSSLEHMRQQIRELERRLLVRRT